MKNRSGFFLRIICVIGIILVIYMVVNIQLRLDDMKEQRDELFEEVERQADKVEELQYEIRRPIDDEEFLIELAREKLGYYRYDDIIFYYNRGE